MKYKTHFVRFLFFSLLFLALDFVYIFTNYFNNDYETLTTAIMDNSVGYNNLYYIAGIVVTIVYIISINRIAVLSNSALVVQKGKSGYVKYFLKKVIIDALLISIEFVGAQALICTFRFKSELLIDTGFFQCCVLYSISLFGYFTLVGISEILINIIFNFNKFSCIITIALFVGINSLILCGVNISPVYFSEFIADWFQNGSFDYLEYIINIFKCSCSVLVIFYVSNIIFQRKDLIFDEVKD